MIFEKEFVSKIQSAIAAKDIDFFQKRLHPQKRVPRHFPFASALMLSAHNAKHLNKLDELRAGAVILNLEDGVAPEYKEVALYATAFFLQQADEKFPLLVVRVNPLEEGGEKEIALLNDFYPDAIRVPKIKESTDVQKALALIKEPIFVHFSIETKEALRNLAHLKTDRRIKAYYLGILDLLSDMGIPQSILHIANPTIDYILSKFLIASKATGVHPVSFVYQEYQNLDEFEAWCRYEKEMGFSAKGCISPNQAAIANRIFKEVDIERALYIKNRFEKMAAKGVTGFSDEKYGFIDEPIYKDALNTLKGL